MSDEWGPWIEHDGKGCPCVGQMVDVVYKDGETAESVWGGPVIATCSHSWFWLRPRPWSIIRYRIRKPRGLTILEGLLEILPVEVPA
mgnify:FL=1